MLVLVNEAQKKALAKAEARDDRFDRAVESGYEALEKPSNPLHVPKAEATVPEPGTILLVGVGIMILVWLAWRRRFTRTFCKKNTRG